MPPFRKLKEGKNGWTSWQYPVMTGYLLACCDCGLVHRVEFKTVKVILRLKGGGFLYEPMPPKFRVKLRAKRANGHTAKLRKKEGITVTH